MMITKIKLRNFKCFDGLELPCSGLTLLCGLNGMGKSSVIQALLVLRQSFVSRELIEGRLVLGGELADLGTGQDVLFEGAESDVVEFELYRSDISLPLRLSFDYSRTADELKSGPNFDDERAMAECISRGWDDVPPLGGGVIYVNAERIGPRKFYGHSEVLARGLDMGRRGEYAVNYLSSHQDETLPTGDLRVSGLRSRRLGEVVNSWLQEVTPGVHLQLDTVQSADAIIAGYSFERPGDVMTRRYRATNVGFGLSYTLPVLIGLLGPAGSLCLLENPEAHVHPRGQTKLAELAVRASRAGVQVIVETHSDHFMDGVRIAIREGLIHPNEVTFHYFERDGGKTVVSSPEVSADGRLSSWPAGFFDQHEENLSRLVAPKP